MSETVHASFTSADFRLESGEVLPQVTIAYCTRGRLAGDGRNAVLVTHGYTSGHRMIESGAGSSEGSWSALVGPGAPIDTDRCFVVCSNMLGSSYGSTNAGSAIRAPAGRTVRASRASPSPTSSPPSATCFSTSACAI